MIPAALLTAQHHVHPSENPDQRGSTTAARCAPVWPSPGGDRRDGDDRRGGWRRWHKIVVAPTLTVVYTAVYMGVGAAAGVAVVNEGKMGGRPGSVGVTAVAVRLVAQRSGGGRDGS